MTTNDIFKSGFIKAFVNEYFEDKTYSFYPDKDRLLYVLCNSEEDKKKVTLKQIEITKLKIIELGFEELSFAYLSSCKPESQDDYIERNKGFDFWLQRFSESFEDHTIDFDPITKATYLFNEVSELSLEVMENESEFWAWYPQNQHPKITDFISIIPNEVELLSLIEYDIQVYEKNEYWEFDFEEYKRFVPVSKPIEILFNLSELLVQLNRLEMFKDFLLIENEKSNYNTDKDDYIEQNKGKLWFKVGVLFASGEIEKRLKENSFNFTRTAKELGNESFRPYISESYNNTTKGDKNIFSSQHKIKEIIKYCNQNKIEIAESFTSKSEQENN